MGLAPQARSINHAGTLLTVISAYQDENLWARLFTAGLDLMHQEFYFERGLARLKQRIEDILGSSEARENSIDAQDPNDAGYSVR